MKYLIDTNVFWEILRGLAGVPIAGSQFRRDEIRNGEYYISEITKLEIISVLGKYARGVQEQWQPCDRVIRENGEKCQHRYYQQGRKKWNKRQVRDMQRLIKDILEGNSSLFSVHILPFERGVLEEAETFIPRSLKYKFASLDAVIAGTAIFYASENLHVITRDKSFRQALTEADVGV